MRLFGIYITIYGEMLNNTQIFTLDEGGVIDY